MSDGETELLELSAKDLSLATDLYQLTMAAAYLERRPMPRATFELFVRHLPPHRNFLIFCGLEQALASLLAFRFHEHQIEYLRSLPPFQDLSEEFFQALRDFRFQGEVWAMPEGTVFFPQEPVLRVTGTLLEAQLVETLLLSIINFQSTIASKAARIRLAAGEKVKLAEFGSRRAHGPQAAAWAARAAYVAGFDATSNVLAGHKQGIPVVGTMAHSYIMSFPEEKEAFLHYQRVFPQQTIHLVDTYDTLEGVRKALATGKPFQGVRLDSGDIGRLAREVRKLLDEHGHQDAQIFASGDMNEQRIVALLDNGAPIDAFGVGTQLSTSADAPYLGGIYKLVEVEIDGKPIPRFKASEGKVTYPGKKQVVRRLEEGRMVEDRILPLAKSEGVSQGESLLRPVLRQGTLLESPSVEEARAHCLGQLAKLPERLRRLEGEVGPYPVIVDSSLEALLAKQMEKVFNGSSPAP